jgi:hypothetical protein
MQQNIPTFWVLATRVRVSLSKKVADSSRLTPVDASEGVGAFIFLQTHDILRSMDVDHKDRVWVAAVGMN